MLQSQGTPSLSELKTSFVCQGEKPDFIFNSVNTFRLSAANRCFVDIKAKGANLVGLFTSLLTLPFLGVKSIHEAVTEPLVAWITTRKDTFYRMKNCHDINWRAILWVFAKQFIKISQDSADSNSTKGGKCLIFDDSVLHKTSRCIENISNVWNHVSNRSVIGFKLLLGLYYDGISMLPVAFSLHRERGKNVDKPFGFKKRELTRIFKRSRPCDSPDFTRTQETEESKITMCLQMIKRAFSHHLDTDHVLTDSWFTCWDFVDLLAQHPKTFLETSH